MIFNDFNELVMHKVSISHQVSDAVCRLVAAIGFEQGVRKSIPPSRSFRGIDNFEDGNVYSTKRVSFFWKSACTVWNRSGDIISHGSPQRHFFSTSSADVLVLFIIVSSLFRHCVSSLSFVIFSLRMILTIA